ncbi:MAG TPA: dihydroneopterin aldolase [Sphingobacterium sp.]|nr:dihydroneopterin aldolase [Sphingobacterium sp.]
MLIQKVAIEDARFHSPIGYYEEERKLGNEFLVDIQVSLKVDFTRSDELDDTLNYEELYKIVSNIMEKERKLLESAAQEILIVVKNNFDFADLIDVKIRKLNPPFGGDLANASVQLVYEK